MLGWRKVLPEHITLISLVGKMLIASAVVNMGLFTGYAFSLLALPGGSQTALHALISAINFSCIGIFFILLSLSHIEIRDWNLYLLGTLRLRSNLHQRQS